MRPTVNDLAREAGVSLATVDRVLNARPGVREKTVRAVNEAIDRLGYVRNVAAANLARQRRYRFLFILPDVETQFLQGLQAAIREAARGPLAEASDIVIATVPQRDPHAIVSVVDRLGDQPVDGCAIMAHETPDVHDLIVRLKSAGTAVVTLVTDQPRAPRDRFVGIDNRAAGRTAAVLLGRFVGQRPGKMSVVVSSILARDLVYRRLGFDEVLAERFPNLQSLPSLGGHDDRKLTARITAACFAAHDDVLAIYVAGAGTRGVVILLPLVWIISTSFKTGPDSISYPPKVVFEPSPEGYVNLFATRTRPAVSELQALPPPETWYDEIVRRQGTIIVGPSRFGERFLNSVIIGFGSTFLSIVLGTLAAYAFSRFKISL